MGNLKSVNLSISSACGADCVFCPSDRGTRIRTKNMPLEIAKKIVDELASPEYRDLYDTKQMHIGENGDCFINKEAIEILRYIKTMRPDISIAVYTDAQFFTEEKIDIVLREQLMNFVGINIDGASAEKFYATKCLDSKHHEQFLSTFSRLRDKYKATTRLDVLSLTMRHYVDAVRTHLNHDPIRIENQSFLDLDDDFELIKKKVIPLLRDGDCLHRSVPMFWAERRSTDTNKLDYCTYTCPLIQRVQNEAFIAPDGTWYACCFDSNNEPKSGSYPVAATPSTARGGPLTGAMRSQM
jgi:hypothetical protein